MKRALFFALLLSAGTFVSAQTFVSTTPSYKNVVLEEFTGVACQYCPDGHRMVSEIVAAHPNRVFPINIHAGSFAANTFIVQDGENIRANWNVTSFPAGMINRTIFTGSSPVCNRGYFSSYANAILAQRTPVNIAARCTINAATRQMTVNVELFYTSSSQVDTNYLSVALLQDNILGRQSGMAYNPTQVIDGQYNHMHMFRGFINGNTWGDTIATTDSGTFVSKTYNYTIPATISSTAVKLQDLGVVAFVTESKKNILNGCKAEIFYVNANPIVRNIKNSTVYQSCAVEFPTYITLFNMSTDTMHSVTVKYGTNLNGAQTITRSGLNILPSASDTINLPVFSSGYTSGAQYTAYAALTNYNGTAVTQDSVTCKMKKIVKNASGDTLTLTLTTDNYGSETSYRFTTLDGRVIKTGDGFGNSTTYTIKIKVPSNDCYIFELLDAAGDGINGGYGNGSFSMTDNRGTVFSNNGQFTDVARYFLYCTGVINDIETASAVDFAVYPNPTSNTLNIECAQKVNKIEIYDMQGKLTTTAFDTKTINVSALSNGTYIVRIATADGMAVKTFVKE